MTSGPAEQANWCVSRVRAEGQSQPVGDGRCTEPDRQLLQGALTQLGATPTTVRLVPFVKPHLCLAYLTPDQTGTDAVSPAPTTNPTEA